MKTLLERPVGPLKIDQKIDQGCCTYGTGRWPEKNICCRGFFLFCMCLQRQYILDSFVALYWNCWLI